MAEEKKEKKVVSIGGVNLFLQLTTSVCAQKLGMRISSLLTTGYRWHCSSFYIPLEYDRTQLQRRRYVSSCLSLIVAYICCAQ
jgi:hypothetical protein